MNAATVRLAAVAADQTAVLGIEIEIAVPIEIGLGIDIVLDRAIEMLIVIVVIVAETRAEIVNAIEAAMMIALSVLATLPPHLVDILEAGALVRALVAGKIALDLGEPHDLLDVLLRGVLLLVH